jgi:hypothetical protein
MKLDAKALGLTSAILAGIFWLVAMVISLLTGFGEETLTTWGSWYPFFTYGWVGMIIVVVENFIAYFIAGAVFAWLYNQFIKGSSSNQA